MLETSTITQVEKLKEIYRVPTLVKWAGGKKQLLTQFDKFFPNKIERYIEPFVGGGAVAFHIIKRFEPKFVLLSDINEEIVNAYNVVKNNVPELVSALTILAKNHSKEFFYKIREVDPNTLSNIEMAARFIYLNKTCFNGLYRVNSQGKFNVPIGSYKNPHIIDVNSLLEINKLLKNVIIKAMPFENVLEFAKKGDFIYLDPPYYPIKEGKSFTKYSKNDFSRLDQERLASLFNKLDSLGCKIMLSNSDTAFIRNLYRHYTKNIVHARRMINSDAGNRGAISELVITNYL
ncbi:MAG: DNA adenine methylase [Candidatus Parvarchaeum sp.]